MTESTSTTRARTSLTFLRSLEQLADDGEEGASDVTVAGTVVARERGVDGRVHADQAVDRHRSVNHPTEPHECHLRREDDAEHGLRAAFSQVRAVTDRWIPRLEGALARVVLSLEETERAEGVGLRWALRAQEPRDDGP